MVRHQGGPAESACDNHVIIISYLLTAAGLVIVASAYIWLLCAEASESIVPQVAVAVLGFLVATLGFVIYAVEDKRRRKADSWRWSQMMGEFDDLAIGTHNSGHGAPASGLDTSPGAWASRDRFDFTQPN